MPQESGTEKWLKGVWGTSSTDVYAVGYEGTIINYDGFAWSDMDYESTVHLRGIWGSAQDDSIYAVGDNGTVVHFDGVTWSERESGTTEGLYGVWGSSATDVYAVGETGTILHYDGINWSAMESGTTAGLLGVWGSSATDVHAVGETGTILHYDGVNWSAVESGTEVDLYGVWGSTGTNVYTVGGQGTILHYSDDAGDGTCLIKNLYGEHSEMVARMRLFRDDRLVKALGGRMAIRAYYSLSPLMVKTIGYDEGFKGALKALIDTVLE